MVSPLFPAIGRATVQVWAKYGPQQGWSLNKIASEMVAAGQGYRRTTMLADLRSILERERKVSAALSVPKKYKPSVNVFSESPYKLKQPYQAAVEFRGISSVTGDKVYHTVYVEFQTPPSVKEIEDMAASKWAEEYAEREEAEWTSFQFTGGYHRAEAAFA
jgi:hypothetical protein